MSAKKTSSEKIAWFKRALHWLDEHLMLLWSGFLLAFIPLYPKIPLFSPIEQYIVRVRLEDVFILLAFILWFIYWLRGKVTWKKPIVYAFLAYIGVGLLSVLSAVFIIQTVPLEPLHLGKTLLHYFRYIQYFSLFFILFSAIKTKRHIHILLATIAITVALIAFYGYGQRHWYWPVYSTMNREFSKGVRLYLTEHARVQSTFAGHYDLAGYLVIILPILLSFAFTAQKKLHKVVLHAVHWTGLWLLVASAARTSFAAYILAVTIVTALLALREKTWKDKLIWWVTRYAFIGIIISYTFVAFGDDIYDRFLQTLQSYPEVHKQYHELNHQRKVALDTYVYVPLGLKSFDLPQAQKPDGALSTDEAFQIIVRSDERPSTEKPRPADVPYDIPVIVAVTTTSADGETITVLEERERTFSPNAQRYGLSLAIRLDTLWPQAIDGFKRNPLVGSGYATLNKQGAYDFTEADSTDNNFLRTLGETGLLGFITFYGIIALALYYAWLAYYSQDVLLQTLAVGYIAGTIALLANAIYIDVFAASKVAQIFWALTGLLLAYYYQDQEQNETNSKA